MDSDETPGASEAELTAREQVAALLNDPSQFQAQLAAARTHFSQEARLAANELASCLRGASNDLHDASSSLEGAADASEDFAGIVRRVQSRCDEVSHGRAAAGIDSRLALQQQLSAAKSNTAMTLDSLNMLQRTLPRALAALRARLAAASSTADYEDIEDLYEELARLDAQGSFASATLHSQLSSTSSPPHHGTADAFAPAHAARTASVTSAMSAIARELRLAWHSLRDLLLSAFRDPLRLARRAPMALLRCARLAETHDAAAKVLCEQSSSAPGVVSTRGVMHAHGAPSLAEECARVVRTSFSQTCRATLCSLDEDSPSLQIPSAAAAAAVASDEDAFSGVDAVVHSLSQAHALLLTLSTFTTVVAPCLPPHWHLSPATHASARSALRSHLARIAARAHTLESDDILRLVGWADSGRVRALDAAADAAARGTGGGLEEAVSALEGTVCEAVQPAREEYACRLRASLERWIGHIFRDAAAGDGSGDASGGGGGAAASAAAAVALGGAPWWPWLGESSAAAALVGQSIVQSTAPVDIFRIIAAQRRALATAQPPAPSLAPLVAGVHAELLAGYARRLTDVARWGVVRDSQGGLMSESGTVERLLTAANDGHACARHIEDDWDLGASDGGGAGEDEEGAAFDTPPTSPRTPKTPQSILAQPGSPSFPPLDASHGDANMRPIAASFDAASRSAMHRLVDVIVWDVESVLWRAFTPFRYAAAAECEDGGGGGGSNEGDGEEDAAAAGRRAESPACVQSALATIADYKGDLAVSLLPPLVPFLLSEAAKRTAVTYAGLLLLGPPISPTAASVPWPSAEAMRRGLTRCVAADAEAICALFSDWGVPYTTLDAIKDLLGCACALAAAPGAATASATASSVIEELGPRALPTPLLRRIANCGVWSEWGSSMRFEGEESAPAAAVRAIGDAIGTMLEPLTIRTSAMAQTSIFQSRGGSSAAVAPIRRRHTVTWALPQMAESANAATRANAASPSRGPSIPPGPTLASLASSKSFAYLESDFAEGDDAAAEALQRTFFSRVEALAAKRADGRRPPDGSALLDEEFPPFFAAGGRVAGPWSRLGALKRRATGGGLWNWRGGEGGGGQSGRLERRATMGGAGSGGGRGGGIESRSTFGR